jgi:inward rectifier potassium channel
MADETLSPAIEAVELTEIEKRDLGFGTVVTRGSRQRLLNQDGTFNVRKTGLPAVAAVNLYHSLLAMRWGSFLMLILLLYFTSNVIFGILYTAIGDGSLVDTSAEPLVSGFVRGFFFSVQTFATIGYGTIHPVGIFPNLLVTLESYYSLLANALITGLVFARFARPTARVIFSEISVIAPYHGISGLMVRLVNGRSSQLIEVNATVMYSRFVEEKGRTVRRFDSLSLEREKVSFFPLAWTIVHPITSDSPLFGVTHEDLVRSDAEILVLITATDETFAAVVHTRSSYKPNEIRIGHKFVNLYNEVADDEPISIDIRKLSLSVPAELPRTLGGGSD